MPKYIKCIYLFRPMFLVFRCCSLSSPRDYLICYFAPVLFRVYSFQRRKTKRRMLFRVHGSVKTVSAEADNRFKKSSFDFDPSDVIGHVLTCLIFVLLLLLLSGSHFSSPLAPACSSSSRVLIKIPGPFFQVLLITGVC